MLRKANQILPLAVLLVAGARAQAVTSYIPTCPTVSSTTITIDTTTTLCPGNCGYQPQVTTFVGPDGTTTVEEEFMYTAPCPCAGGVCDATYTVTRPCPCTEPHPATEMPAGFTSAAVACDVCAQNGGPSTVTVITPCSDSPYASQTPAMGAPYNGASASAGASAWASAGPNGAAASAGANAEASAGNGSAAANAGANANANANNEGAAAAASASASASASAAAAANQMNDMGSNMNNTSGSTPASGMSTSNSDSTSPVATYHGSADRAAFAVSAVVAGVVGFLSIYL